jgi:GGDEF domain-containing protein
MTFDVLVIALAALVLSNVVLLVAAARSGALGGVRGEKGDDRSVRPRPERPAAPAARDAQEFALSDLPAPMSDLLAPPSEPPRVTEPPLVTEPPHELEHPEAVIDETAAAIAASPGPSEAASTEGPAATASAGDTSTPRSRKVSAPTRPSDTAPRRTGTARRGRRFTLPSIEVDHARTERVVLSLLSGDDEAAGGEMVDVWDRLVGPAGSGETERAAVVVALTLDGLDRLTETSGRETADRLIGVALDAIRRSARGSDRVASVGRGHFRVLLVDADEAVATRFVARVREATDRRLAMATSPVGLAAGWAHAESAGHLERAVHAAEEHRRRDAEPPARRSEDRSPA